MQGADLFSQGVELALVGMGTVFAFLVLLIFATVLMSRLATRLAPVADAAPISSEDPAGTPDDEVVAVISAAIHMHRARRRRR